MRSTALALTLGTALAVPALAAEQVAGLGTLYVDPKTLPAGPFLA